MLSIVYSEMSKDRVNFQIDQSFSVKINTAKSAKLLESLCFVGGFFFFYIVIYWVPILISLYSIPYF